MATPAKPILLDIYPVDEACIEEIKVGLGIESRALAVRLAIRSLAERLSRPEQLEERPAKNITKENPDVS